MTRIFDLQLFADASGAAASAAATTGQVGQSDGNNGGQEKVVYGIEAPEDAAREADGQTQSDETIDIEAEYEQLIRGKFKNVHAKHTQQIINKRFKEAKTTEERLSKAQPILDTLIERYKTDDLGKIDELMQKDADFWRGDSDTEGLTDEQAAEMRRLKRVERGVKQAEAAASMEQARAARAEQLGREASALKARYPAFDLRREMDNPEFIDLVQKGVSMETAFKAIYFDEFMGGAVERTEQQTADAVVANVRARGARPAENGAKKSSGVVRKSDPSALTKADRADIERRILRGEKISF